MHLGPASLGVSYGERNPIPDYGGQTTDEGGLLLGGFEFYSEAAYHGSCTDGS